LSLAGESDAQGIGCKWPALPAGSHIRYSAGRYALTETLLVLDWPEVVCPLCWEYAAKSFSREV